MIALSAKQVLRVIFSWIVLGMCIMMQPVLFSSSNNKVVDVTAVTIKPSFRSLVGGLSGDLFSESESDSDAPLPRDDDGDDSDHDDDDDDSTTSTTSSTDTSTGTSTDTTSPTPADSSTWSKIKGEVGHWAHVVFTDPKLGLYVLIGFLTGSTALIGYKKSRSSREPVDSNRDARDAMEEREDVMQQLDTDLAEGKINQDTFDEVKATMEKAFDEGFGEEFVDKFNKMQDGEDVFEQNFKNKFDDSFQKFEDLDDLDNPFKEDDGRIDLFERVHEPVNNKGYDNKLVKDEMRKGQQFDQQKQFEQQKQIDQQRKLNEDLKRQFENQRRQQREHEQFEPKPFE
jgi:hypothetical protein